MSTLSIPSCYVTGISDVLNPATSGAEANYYYLTTDGKWVYTPVTACFQAPFSSGVPRIAKYVFDNPSSAITQDLSYIESAKTYTTITSAPAVSLTSSIEAQSSNSGSAGAGSSTNGSSSSVSETLSSSGEASSNGVASATSETNAPSATPSRPIRDKTPYDGGVVAGAAIGAAIGAALLAILFTYLCLRKRRNDRVQSRERGSTPDVVVFGKGSDSQAASEESHSYPEGIAWMKHLPQPADDNTIAMRIKTLYNQIQLHVENFYENANIRGSTIPDDAQEALLDLDSGLLPASLPAAILHSSGSTSVIKHTLAHLIVSSISIHSPAESSFLPAEYAGLTQNLRRQDNERSNPGFAQSLSQYRAMTAYLRPDPANDQYYLKQREANIKLAAETFGSAFERWAKDPIRTSSIRLQNLKEIMRSAAETGILIFAQPAAFDYQWSGAHQQGQSFVTLPAFVKVADEKGVRLEKPAVMVNQTIENM